MQQPMTPYQQGLPQQQLYPQQQMPQQSQPLAPQTQQIIKFYKSGIFLFASAAGRMQRDVEQMQAQGYRLQHVAMLGMNIFLRRIIVAIWVR